MNLLKKVYEANHDDPRKMTEFYQYVHDLADFKTTELVLGITYNQLTLTKKRGIQTKVN